jgi:hypothetical protein
MRQSAIVLAVGLSAAIVTSPVAAKKETVLTFAYVAQENCIWAPDFTPFPDFDAYNYAGMGFSDYNGTWVFDLSNNKALQTSQGTFQVIPGGSPNPFPGPSGLYPVVFWNTPAQCVFDLHLSADLSFSLESTSAGCLTTVLNGPGMNQSNTVYDISLTGHFSSDMQSFIAGHAGWNQQQQPVVQRQVLHQYGDYTQKRVCTSMLHGVRVGR